MTPEFIFSQGLAVAMIVSAAMFGWRELWPWWKERDNVERERRHALKKLHGENDAQMAAAIALGANGLSMLAEAVASCPLQGVGGTQPP